MQHLVLKTTFRFIVPAVTRGGHRRIRRDTSGGSGAKGGEREQSPSEPCTAVLFSGMIARPRKAGEIITETPPTWGVHVYNGHASRVVRWCVPGSSPRMFRGRPVRHVFRPPVRACGLSHHRFLGHSGVPPRQVAEWAGHSLDVLLRIYVRILDGSEYESRRRGEAGFEDF